MRNGLSRLVAPAYLASSLLLVACQGQMRDQISLRAQESPLPVPVDHVAMHAPYVDDQNLDFPPGDVGGPVNPFKPSDHSLDLGKRQYEGQCAPCHGLKGAGDGSVGAVFFVPPTALDNARFKAMSDGQLYLRIVKGGAANGAIMASYAKKLTVEERWAVVNYIKGSIVK